MSINKTTKQDFMSKLPHQYANAENFWNVNEESVNIFNEMIDIALLSQKSPFDPHENDGFYLDQCGSNWNVFRMTNELDEDFRQRIQSKINSTRSSGNILQVIDALIDDVFDGNENAVNVREINNLSDFGEPDTYCAYYVVELAQFASVKQQFASNVLQNIKSAGVGFIIYTVGAPILADDGQTYEIFHRRVRLIDPSALPQVRDGHIIMPSTKTPARMIIKHQTTNQHYEVKCRADRRLYIVPVIDTFTANDKFRTFDSEIKVFTRNGVNITWEITYE